jgi:hypothetical protein
MAALDIVSLLQSSLPVYVPSQTKVRIFAGLGSTVSTGTNGNVLAVALWVGVGGFIGSLGIKEGYTPDGGFVDLAVQPPSAGD